MPDAACSLPKIPRLLKKCKTGRPCSSLSKVANLGFPGPGDAGPAEPPVHHSPHVHTCAHLWSGVPPLARPGCGRWRGGGVPLAGVVGSRPNSKQNEIQKKLHPVSPRSQIQTLSPEWLRPARESTGGPSVRLGQRGSGLRKEGTVRQDEGGPGTPGGSRWLHTNFPFTPPGE